MLESGLQPGIPFALRIILGRILEDIDCRHIVGTFGIDHP